MSISFGIYCGDCKELMEVDINEPIVTCPHCGAVNVLGNVTQEDRDEYVNAVFEETIREIIPIRIEASSLDDESLVDEMLSVIHDYDFMKGTENGLFEYANSGTLTEENRVLLEGAYILAHTRYMLEE